MEQNVRSSSLYRKYNDDVPQYLRNRPRRLIDDIRKKMISVEPEVVSGVCQKSADVGVFLVPARGARPFHEVVFGDESTFCSCTCLSFERTRLLCTHFCAVFRARTDWTFDRVSPVYTQCPLLTLDEDILQAGTQQTTHVATDAPATPPAAMEHQSSPERLLKSGKQKVRALLRTLYEMTSTVSDVTAMETMLNGLKTVHSDVSRACAGEAGASTDQRKRKLNDQAETTPPSAKRTEPEVQVDSQQVNSQQVKFVEVHVINREMRQQEIIFSAAGPTFILQ